MLVVCLVKEHIFAIIALCRIFLKNALSANSVLMAQLFPKLVADCPISYKLESHCEEIEVMLNLNTYSSCHTGQLAT